MKYLHAIPPSSLPDSTSLAPFRAVVISELSVSDSWRMIASDWLVESGCLYMMAWGHDASAWDDSVDMANLKKFDFGDIPEDCFVLTTWHDDGPLEEVFWFCKYSAYHSAVDIRETLVLDISDRSREDEIASIYADV